jgi:hypothetical protein
MLKKQIHASHTLPKSSIGGIKNINLKSKTLKCLEEYPEICLYELGIGKNFLDSKDTIHKEKIDNVQCKPIWSCHNIQ